jgi:hypothetical protein
MDNNIVRNSNQNAIAGSVTPTNTHTTYTNITMDILNKEAGEIAILINVIDNETSEIIPGMNVTISIFKGTTLAETITFNTTNLIYKNTGIDNGTYIITIRFNNYDKYIGSLIEGTIDVTNKTKEIEILKDENKKLATEKDDANKALADKTAEAATLQTQVESLTKQNNQLTSDLKTANSKADNANANLKKVKAASKVKKSKNFKITATLNKKVKGKYVYVIFNGKSYKAKTNKNGVAKITIKKSALKKLGGKKVKYQVISGQKLINKSVKIKK